MERKRNLSDFDEAGMDEGFEDMDQDIVEDIDDETEDSLSDEEYSQDQYEESDAYVGKTGKKNAGGVQEPYDEKSARRMYRRKRRLRNQIIAYGVSLVLVAAAICGAVYGGGVLVRNLNRNKPAEVVDEQESEQEVFEINTPDTTVTPTEEETGYDAVTEEVVDYYLSQMSVEEKVAGLFFVTPESMMDGVDQAVMAGGKTQEAMNAYAVGGIIYFAKNIQSESQITEMLAKTQEMSKYPLFFGVDEEGGSVARVADSLSDIAKTENASEMGASGDTGNAYNAYYQIGTYLKQLGFNVDFAPDADIYNGSNAMFAERSFGTDADTVSSFAYQAIYGLQDTGVSACAKHFPGHGNTDADSHEGRATDESTEEELLAGGIVPFQSAVTAESDFIMVGQISLPNIISDYTPATMSSDIVTRILRNQLGYNGIIITDAMNMTSVTDYYTSTEAAINALNAGCDMILMPENFKEAYQGVIDAVNNGGLTVDRLDESLRRIYRVKCKGMTMADLGLESTIGATEDGAAGAADTGAEADGTTNPEETEADGAAEADTAEE